MLYNKDPIMPFDMADKVQNDSSFVESEDSSGNEKLSSNTCIDESDKIFEMVQVMSKEHKEIFQTADQRICKAQKHQAKGYNNRHAVGTKFETGMKELKLDCCQAGLLRKAQGSATSAHTPWSVDVPMGTSNSGTNIVIL